MSSARRGDWSSRPGSLTSSRGWSAKVNGREEPIQRADYAYRAVPVPAGRSTVEMHYRTPGLRLGLAVSLVGLLAAVGLVLYAWRRRRTVT